MAFESFYGRCIYDGCCRMELILGQIISDANKRQIPIEDVKPVEKFMTVNPSRSEVPMNIGYSQVVASIDSTQQVKASLQQQLPDSQLHFEVHQATRELLKESSGDSFKVSEMQTRRSQEICQTELPDSSIETKQLDFDSVTSPTIGTCFESFGEPFSEMLEIEEHARASFGPTTTDIVESWVLRETWDLDIDKDIEESQIPSASLKNMAKLVDEPFGSIALSWADFKVSSFGFLADSSAHNMFDEIPGAQGGHRLDVLNVSTTPLPSRDGNCAKVNYLTGINTHSLLEFRNSIARSRYFESDVKYAGNVARSVSIISRYAGDDGVGTLSFDPGGQPSRKLTEHCLDLFSHGGPLLKFNAPIEASCLLLNSTQDTNSLIDKNCRIESLKFDLEGGFMINVSAEVWEISGESHTLGSHLLDLNATVYAYWKPRGDDLIMSEGPVQIETRDELNEMLSWFLERFADPDVFNRYKQTPLMLAAMRGKLLCVQKLIHSGASILMFDSKNGRTCLHYAVLYGHSECVETIRSTSKSSHVVLSWGFARFVNIRDGKGTNPDASSIDKRHGIGNWNTTMTYFSNTGMNLISYLSFPIFECNELRKWVKDCSVVCGIKTTQQLESVVIDDDNGTDVCFERNLMQILVIVCGSFDARQVLEEMSCANLSVELKWVIQRIISFSQKSVALQKIVLAASSSFPYDRGEFVIEDWVYHKCSAEPMWIIQATASSKNDEVGMGSVLLQFWVQVHCKFQQETLHFEGKIYMGINSVLGDFWDQPMLLACLSLIRK